ncbi:hypothetical protein [Abyssogena phaseoliformis symbiont]|uniref:hypothetical protein n=1 Tax=Abyssogena phaseoliformis symbiont TaxID=596095 RepID=UPI001915A731|nr:hypothetical protein [Abyssogena phaseoliformis symbiont]
MVLVSAILSTTKLKHKAVKENQEGNTQMDRFLLGISNIATDYPKAIVLVSTLMILITVFFDSQLRFSHLPLKWFPENNTSRIATEVVDEELRSSITLEVIVDTGKENGLYEPVVLNKIESTSRYLNSI